MSTSTELSTRFSRVAASLAPIPAPDTCLRFAGYAGGKWPTPGRGHWFPKEEHPAALRETLRRLCQSSTPLAPPNNNGSSTIYRITLYQRDRSRKLIEEKAAIGLIKSSLDSSGLDSKAWEVHVLVHEDSRSPCSLAQELQFTDVLLTAHGFQSMLLLFLPRPAILFEIFPYRYFKRGYCPLSTQFGIIHSGVMSPPIGLFARMVLTSLPTRVCFASKHCRGLARGDDVRLTQHGANRLVRLIKTHISVLGSNTLATRDTLFI